MTISGGMVLANSSGKEGGDSSLIFICDLFPMCCCYSNTWMPKQLPTKDEQKNASIDSTQTANASSWRSGSTRVLFIPPPVVCGAHGFFRSSSS
jgi:hypothetical protein